MKSAKTWCVRLSLVLGAVVMNGLLLEGVVLRGFMGRHPVRSEGTIFAHDALLGWRLAPGASGVHCEYEFCVSYRANSKGLRDREHAYEKPADTFRIVVLGDSFAQGVGVGQDEMFAERLEQGLNERVGRRYEVINAGVNGYSSDQEVLWFERDGIRYSPDLVVLSFCDNDVVNMAAMEFNYVIYHKPYFELGPGGLVLKGVPVPDKEQPWAGDPRVAIKDAARKRLALYGFMANTLGLRKAIRESMYALGILPDAEQPDGGEEGIGRLSSVEDIRASGMWKIERAILDRLHDHVRQAGARLVIFSVSSRSRFHPLLQEYLRAKGVDYFAVDERAPFVDALKRGQTVAYRYDGHWTAVGHALVAESILRFLDESGLLK